MKINSLFNIKNKVIVITGGSGFLGKAYINFLTKLGGEVFNLDINDQNSVDITKEDVIKKEITKIFNKNRRIDILINNASLNPHIGSKNNLNFFSDLESYNVELFRKGLEIDLVGSFIMSKNVVPLMKKVGQGIVVNISSIYGLIAPDQRLYKGIKNPLQPKKDIIKPVFYSLAKAGIWGLTRYLASYGAPQIRVNQLTLGGIYNQEKKQFVNRYSAKTMLNRMGRTTDIFGPLLYLISDASSYMTGANLIVDGGYTAW